ncbi:MAG: hypothetical protein RR388_05350 [Rikenellaceae bacterium]
MKRIYLIIVLIFSAFASNAQSDAIIESLSKVNDLGSRVVISGDVTAAKSSSVLPSDKFRGFRVRIFFDNKQTSRNDAASAVERFKLLYPYMSTYIDYVPPYFKVTVGDFLTRLEAVALWGKIKTAFPTAFVVTENIAYEALLKVNTETVIDESAEGESVDIEEVKIE